LFSRRPGFIICVRLIVTLRHRHNIVVGIQLRSGFQQTKIKQPIKVNLCFWQ
jgi:hypothetical protein